MANMKYNFSNGSSGKVTYNSDIVSSIVSIAVQEVEGVDSITPNKGIRLYFEKDGVYVEVSVIVKYSNSVPDLAFRIQQSIKQAVESMTNYKIANISVHIQDVVFPEAPKPQTELASKKEEIKEENKEK